MAGASSKSAAVRAAVSLPLLIHGKLNHPSLAEEVFEKGLADVILMGHQSLADPEYAKKLKQGRVLDIRPCIGCNECLYSSFSHRDKTCAVNVCCYHEEEYKLESSPKDESVLVIGGGPGGMRASITAAQRGHQVTLIEKEEELGGQIRHFQKDRFKTDLDIFCRFLQGQVNKYPIKVLLNTKATPKMVQELNPDALILALGAEPILPTIKGLESTQAKVMQAIDVYAHPEQVEGEVVIIGGGATGIETGIYLADEGHHVSVVEIADQIAKQEQDINWRSQLDWILKQVDCTPYTLSKVVEIKNKSVVIEKNNELKEIKADTIVLSVGFKSRFVRTL